HHFNQSVLLELKEPVDSQLLEMAVLELFRRHDVLRMKYDTNERSEWEQWCPEEMPAEVYRRHDLSGMSDEECRGELERDAAQVQASLDLRSGSLLRAVEYDLGAARGKRLLLVMHHLVVDGVSWRILLEDLELGYQQMMRGEPVLLGMKTTSFQQWAQRLQDYAQGSEAKAQLDYWIGEGNKQVHSLPQDPTGNKNPIGAQKTIAVWLGKEQTQELLQRVPEVYHTQVNDVLLTALWRVFAEWTQNELVRV